MEKSQNFEKSQKQWTVKDKENLLKALRKYGHTDINEISRAVGTKGPSAVKLMIHKLTAKARMSSELQRSVTFGMFNDVCLPVPQALNFISLFEKHPSKEESGSFDLRASYNYIYQMTLGHPAPSMSEENIAVLNNLLSEVEKEASKNPEEEILLYLEERDRKKSQHVFRCYPSMHQLESRKILPDRE